MGFSRQLLSTQVSQLATLKNNLTDSPSYFSIGRLLLAPQIEALRSDRRFRPSVNW